MAEWKKIITSGSTAELGGISSSLAIVPTTDNGAMRVAGYQPLPKAGPQRTMVGDGTNPLVRY